MIEGILNLYSAAVWTPTLYYEDKSSMEELLDALNNWCLVRL